jgi:xanthine dehydrogenase YagR molybdenum-binding subunit
LRNIASEQGACGVFIDCDPGNLASIRAIEQSGFVRQGEVRVRRFVACYGAGRILNAKMARSQQIGGIVFGIGMALGEATRLDPASGRITNARLTDYLLPVHADVPDIDVSFVAEDDPHVNATGVKGIGMIGAVGVAAAIANAVFHATGVRVRDLPITPDKLL